MGSYTPKRSLGWMQRASWMRGDERESEYILAHTGQRELDFFTQFAAVGAQTVRMSSPPPVRTGSNKFWDEYGKVRVCLVGLANQSIILFDFTCESLRQGPRAKGS